MSTPDPIPPQLGRLLEQRQQAIEDLAHARMVADACGNSPTARDAVARLERRVALLTARLPVIHDNSRPGEPVALEADQEMQDQADGITPEQRRIRELELAVQRVRDICTSPFVQSRTETIRDIMIAIRDLP